MRKKGNSGRLKGFNRAAARKIGLSFPPLPGPEKVKSSSEGRTHAHSHPKGRVALGMDRSSPRSDLMEIHHTCLSWAWGASHCPKEVDGALLTGLLLLFKETGVVYSFPGGQVSFL